MPTVPKRPRTARRKRVPPAGPGAPSKCTPEVTEAICAGVGESTYWRWKQQGQKEDAKRIFLEIYEVDVAFKDVAKRVDNL